MSIQDVGALIRRLAREPSETEWLEFKENNKDHHRLGRLISALSNAAVLAERDDAFIVFGVRNQNHELVGTNVRLANEKNGGENLQNWLSRKLSPNVPLEFRAQSIDGKHYEVVRISACYDRPLTFDGASYVRVGENLKKLSEFPERERSLWMATGRRRFENSVAMENASKEQLLSLLDVESLYYLMSQPEPSSDEELTRKLVNCGCAVDNMDGTFDITNLGAVALAHRLTDFASVSSKRVRVVRYLGTDKRLSDGEEFVSERGYAAGFSLLVSKVMAKVASREVYRNGVRRQEPVIPETSIRELVSNALVHQDFVVSGAAPVIEVYDDRIEISNPGKSLLHVRDLITERKSRNEQLAELLKDLGICELRGGGIDKALLELEMTNLPAPVFILGPATTVVVVYGPKTFSELSKQDKLRACEQHCILKWLKREPMGNASLRERFGLEDKDYQAVSMVINEAIKQGIISPADPNQGKRNARYIPAWVVGPA